MEPNQATLQVAQQATEAGAALAHGMCLSTPKANPHKHGRAFTLLPEGAKLEYLEQPERPLRPIGTTKLHDAASFLAFVERHAEPHVSVCYGERAPRASFCCVIDEHDRVPTAADITRAKMLDKQAMKRAGWREFRAVYEPQLSREWMAWTKRDGQAFDSPKEFAEWLEDNALDVVKPSGAEMMQIALNFRLTENVVFGAATRLDNGTIDFEYKRIVRADADDPQRPAGKMKVPENFTIEVPVFDGLDAPRFKIEARFRYRLTDDRVRMRYELVRPHKVLEHAFFALWGEIRTGLGQVPLLHGAP